MSSSPPSHRKQITIAVIIFLGLFVFLAVFKGIQIAIVMASSNHQMPPDAVTTIVVEDSVWRESASAVGSLTPVQGAKLSIEEAGTVSKILFESGANVKAGDILVELDTSVEEADLRVATANRDWANQRLVRAQGLRTKGANSLADLQQADAENKIASAEVDAIKSKIDKKRIVAPFDGVTGIRLVNVGDYVAGGAPIVSLQALDTLYIDFSLPQNYANRVKVGQDLEILLTEQASSKKIGKIVAVNPDVDIDMRTFMIRGQVDNKDQQARPGMFVKISVIFPEEKTVATVPLSGIKFAPYGDSLFVVEKKKDEDGTEHLSVREQIVKLGERRGDQVAILEGVKAGDEVVSSGAFKLRQGSAVVVNNSLSPENNPDPKPLDS